MKVLNNSLNFVVPDSEAHTNAGIESTGRALIKSLPKDPFLEFLKLIKRIYNPETRKQKLISKEISIEIHNSKIKKPRILQIHYKY